MKVFLLLLLIFSSVCKANNGLQDSAYHEGKEFTGLKQSNVNSTFSEFDVHQVPGYKTDQPEEIGYSSQDLKALAKQKSLENENAQFIRHHYFTAPKQFIDKQEDFLQHSKRIYAGINDIRPTLNTACPTEDSPCHSPVQPSPDFNQAVSNLSATAEASQDFEANHIFSGYRCTCRQDGFNYNDCCQDKGWGQDLHLAGCNEGEKELGKLKEMGLCHSLGRYCDKRIFGSCIRHKKSYCCFNSKLGRIIQEQGRQQLGIKWGSAETPSCRGFTPEELQHIDFAKIDFSDFYADIEKKQPLSDSLQTKQYIQGEVKNFYSKTGSV